MKGIRVKEMGHMAGNINKAVFCCIMSALIILAHVLTGVSKGGIIPDKVSAKEEVITLRVCNWEEYIDLGDWDEDELIELDNGTEIIGINPLYEDFEQWYYETYGKRVRVEYSCFGTNEDLYNQLTLGDAYDLVCPSDYMIMKLMAEDKAEPFSEDFFDSDNEFNYYAKGVSPYIENVFDENKINGESWKKYAACYMWGITGVLYNPDIMTEEEAATWSVFNNPKFYRQVTLKDNVRDTYFAVLGYLRADLLTSPDFLNDENYKEKLANIMNDVTPDTIEAVEELLQDMMGNVYALETDSGKSDMVTGKIAANYQWSGDAVYAMDLAEGDNVYLKFAVPKECTNLWFDGWLMLKDGIDGNSEKKHAAEAFVNFLSRPDSAVRNMNYIGYTSAIAGEENDDTVFSYLNWCYGAEDDEENAIEYPVGYFFSGNKDDEKYIVEASESQINRQLYSQYPSSEVISRASIMGYFDDKETKNINQMWINVRCFNLKDVPAWVWIALGVGIISAAVFAIRHKYAVSPKLKE